MNGPETFPQGVPVANKKESKSLHEALAEMHKVPHVAEAMKVTAERKAIEGANRGITQTKDVPLRIMRQEKPGGTSRYLVEKFQGTKPRHPGYSDVEKPTIAPNQNGGWDVVTEG